MAPGCKLRNHRARRPVGDVRTAPMPDRCCQLNGSTARGVRPLGAQVARIGGPWAKSLSSRKTRAAFSRWAFSYQRAGRADPACDGSLVALPCPAGGALVSPAQLAQQPPRLREGTAHMANLPDYLGHAFKGPQFTHYPAVARIVLRAYPRLPARGEGRRGPAPNTVCGARAWRPSPEFFRVDLLADWQSGTRAALPGGSSRRIAIPRRGGTP